jgi:hypothetical protein
MQLKKISATRGATIMGANQGTSMDDVSPWQGRQRQLAPSGQGRLLLGQLAANLSRDILDDPLGHAKVS